MTQMHCVNFKGAVHPKMMSLFAQPYVIQKKILFFRASLSITATVHSEHKHSKKITFYLIIKVYFVLVKWKI